MGIKDRIKELRKELHLNQTDFGNKIGIKQSTVAGYENGSSIPLDTVLVNICREFNVNEEWLRSGTGEMFEEVTRDEEIAAFIGGLQSFGDDSFKKRFIHMLCGMTDEEWKILERKIDELVSITKNAGKD